ncbi:MAG: HVO_A0114 family putative DNA-binding protein [Pseudomonadota bacterium]
MRDPAAAKVAPKRWFDSAATARRAAEGNPSAEAMVKLLSPENLALLQAIRRHKPESMRRLAQVTGRKESNLSRTLKKLERAGIVRLTAGHGRTRVPTVVARKVRLEIDLGGADSAVAVEGTPRSRQRAGFRA